MLNEVWKFNKNNPNIKILYLLMKSKFYIKKIDLILRIKCNKYLILKIKCNKIEFNYKP